MEINAKFDIGDQVWLVSANKVITVFVTGVSVNDKPLYDSDQKEQLFPTKSDLINSL